MRVICSGDCFASSLVASFWTGGGKTKSFDGFAATVFEGSDCLPVNQFATDLKGTSKSRNNSDGVSGSSRSLVVGPWSSNVSILVGFSTLGIGISGSFALGGVVFATGSVFVGAGC